MFGGHSFGGIGFGDDNTLYLRVYISLEVTVNFEYRIFVATEELITAADDTPALQPYSGALSEALDFTWSMISGSTFGGFITGRGTTIINNSDAAFDTLTQRYTTDGRPVEVRLGQIGTNQSTWPVVFHGLSSGEFIDDQSFEITTEDNGYKFDVPAQATVYAGTGGLEGGADLEGKPVPLTFGWVLNITPPLIIPNELLFQVNRGPVQAISAVYDQGNALGFYQDFATVSLLRAATIPGGKYATCLAEGYFRVEFDITSDGTVTADVQGDTTDGFAETTVDIIRALIKRSTTLADPGDLYLPSFVALNALQPAPVGIYISHDDTSTVADVISKLMLGIGGYAGFRREGKFYVGRIDAPVGPPTKRFDKYSFDPNPSKQKLPDGIWPPPWKWMIGYQKNWTVISNPAGAVSDDRRSFLAAEYRYSQASAPLVKVDHPFGKDPDPVPALFRDKADSDAEGARVLALYRTARGLYSFGVTDRDAALLNIGEQIFVTHTRGDLILGRYMLIMDMGHKASTHSATLKVYG